MSYVYDEQLYSSCVCDEMGVVLINGILKQQQILFIQWRHKYNNKNKVVFYVTKDDSGTIYLYETKNNKVAKIKNRWNRMKQLDVDDGE